MTNDQDKYIEVTLKDRVTYWKNEKGVIAPEAYERLLNGGCPPIKAKALLADVYLQLDKVKELEVE